MIKITSRPIALVQRGCRVKDIIIQLRLDSEKYYWYYTLQKVFLCLISKLRHADLQLFLHMKVCCMTAQPSRKKQWQKPVSLHLHAFVIFWCCIV